MNTYILKVKVGSTWHDIDFGNDMPAISFQANNLAELQNRQGTYSQSLKLPKTANNKNVLGISSETTIPYTKLECRLWVDSYLLLGAGGVLIIDKVTDFIEVQLLDASVDFIKELQGKKMSSVDLGCYLHGSKNPFNYFKNTDYLIPLALFLKNNNDFDYDANVVDYPFCYIKNIFDKIVGTYSTDLVTNDWNNLVINVADNKADAHTYDSFGGVVFFDLVAGLQFGADYYISENPVANNIVIDEPDNRVYINTNFRDFSAFVDIDIVFPQIFKDPAPQGTCFVLISNGVLSESFDLGDLVNPGGVSFSASLLVDENNSEFFVSITTEDSNYSTLYFQNSYFEVRFRKNEDSLIPISGYYPLSSNLGFETQADFIKSIMQIFALSFYQDRTGAKFFYTMQEVVENKTNAPDWSDKLDMDKPQLAYTFGTYGQKNYINLETDSNGYQKQYTINIADTTLEPEKTLFTLKYESGLDRPVSIVQNIKTVAVVPLEERTDGVDSFIGCKPHICDVVDYTGSVPNYRYLVHKNTDTYYDPIRALLNNIKVIECYFNLTAQDVYNYSPMTPIYIKQYGRYFYINKISNFIAGKKTKVELIKLPL